MAINNVKITSVPPEPPEPAPAPGPSPTPREYDGDWHLVCSKGKCQRRFVQNRHLSVYQSLINQCAGKAEGEDCGGEAKTTLACVGGICKYVEASTPENINACTGKAEGDACAAGFECESNADCPEGYECNAKHQCQKIIKVKCVTDADCPVDYKCINGECIKRGTTTDGGEGGAGAGSAGAGGGEGGVGGEFTWSAGTQGALQRLLDRYNYLMDNPRGTTDAERQAIINFATERIKRGERGEMQSMIDRMSRMGLQGSGFQESEARGIKRGTREDVVSLQRQVSIDELDRRFRELMGGTQMAQGLMGTMMTGEQIPEILSGARREEGNTAMQQFLAYLNMIMGSYGGGASWLQGVLG